MCLALYLELRVAMVWPLYLEISVAMAVFDPLPRTKSGNGCV